MLMLSEEEFHLNRTEVGVLPPYITLRGAEGGILSTVVLHAASLLNAAAPVLFTALPTFRAGPTFLCGKGLGS